MKLIKQTTLHFKQGKSDKIYEVDLLEVEANQFLVNFRYGRHGTTLREGTKTAKPVPRAKADTVFDKLVTSKTSKGYKDVSSSPTPKAPREIDAAAREKAILHRLTQAVQGEYDEDQETHWPLKRVIWRAGELKIKTATPLMLDLLGSNDVLRDYCLVWALGRCGDETAIPKLEQIYRSGATPDLVQRIAAEALLKLWDEMSRDIFRTDLINGLPDPLRELVHTGPSNAFAAALMSHLELDQNAISILETLYLIDNEIVRPALLLILETAPLRPNHFRSIRHIFKAAEYRYDAEVYGRLAYRFATTKAMFTNSYYGFAGDEDWWSGIYTDAYGWIRDGRKEIRKPDSRIAYGSRTRNYFRQRVWRTLRELGQANDPTYIDLAVGMLLPFTDSDAKSTGRSSYYNWDQRSYVYTHWDQYAGYWVLNNILYTNSPRYTAHKKSLAWSCVSPYTPGELGPDVREEAFPTLWEQNPTALLRLILESRCFPVQEFAVRAMRACQDFWADLEVDTVIQILQAPYDLTAQFGFELAQSHYQPAQPQADLVLAVATCAFAEARTQGQQWIETNRAHFLQDTPFVTALVTNQYQDVRHFARNWLVADPIPDASAQALFNQLLETVLTAENADASWLTDVIETLQTCFAQQGRSLPLKRVLDLIMYPRVEIQTLGGNILLTHDVQTDDLPDDVISALIDSPYEAIRRIGVTLFGQLSDETLYKQEAVLIAFSTHEHSDIRETIRPVIQRLAQQGQAFAGRVSALFVQMLLRPETHEGLHNSLVKMLHEDLGQGWMRDVTPDLISDLIQANSTAAQEMAGHLITFKIEDDSQWANQVETTLMVDLANQEVQALRQAAQTLFVSNANRFQAITPNHLDALAEAVRLLDATWDDSRDFGFDFFQTHLTADDFTPAILVSICDSVRPEVQQFGRKLITTYFETEAGPEYLLKLSEHPTAEMQRFATTYLEDFAAGRLERLQQLKPYFISILSRVNKARVAKQRVLEFLVNESEKSEAVAELVIDIFARQSATMAIGDRAAMIEALLQIQQRYPHLSTPIRVREPEVRHAV